eukprot:TRINITY_DN4984_c0_g1_i3.p1 TRINITY_DN4984_c0_g1~~TRINITY_DN4984_c0_g1_i3.p1  ORF type:complete len:193 (+),score=24.96 TRINITY_DN4984_c0_g1_i3:334-912(+)
MLNQRGLSIRPFSIKHLYYQQHFTFQMTCDNLQSTAAQVLNLESNDTGDSPFLLNCSKNKEIEEWLRALYQLQNENPIPPSKDLIGNQTFKTRRNYPKRTKMVRITKETTVSSAFDHIMRLLQNSLPSVFQTSLSRLKFVWERLDWPAENLELEGYDYQEAITEEVRKRVESLSNPQIILDLKAFWSNIIAF